MVTNVSSFGRSGVFDWVVQRLTAVVLAAYTLYLMAVLGLNPDLDYQQWQNLAVHCGTRLDRYVGHLNRLPDDPFDGTEGYGPENFVPDRLHLADLTVPGLGY